MSDSNFDVTQSPCVGICKVNEEGVCTGCLRDVDEIRGWKTANDEERLVILQNIEQRKAQ